jgi:DNA primase
MIRLRGVEAMRACLLGARPLADLLWRRELEAGPVDTPERRAGLEARLQTATASIRHAGVRKAYEREMRDRLFEHFRPTRFVRSEGGGKSSGALPARPVRPVDGRVSGPARQGIIGGPARLAGLGLLVRAIDTPALLGPAREALFAADFPNPDVASIRDAVFDVLDSGETLDRRAVAAHLRNLGRSRSEKLLDEYPSLGSLDLEKGEGREWFSALERFPAAAAVNEAARAVIQEVGGDDMFRHASHLARLRAMIAEREQTRRPSAEQSQGGASEGASDIWSALDGLDGEMKRRFPKD